MRVRENYANFLSEYRKRRRLGNILALLGWDEQVNLPGSAAEDRAEQLSILSTHLHQLNALPEYRELLQGLQHSPELNPDEQIIVREVWRDTERILNVPAELVGQISRAESEAYALWLEARKENSYSVVERALHNLYELKREYAQALPSKGSLYDNLLDLYEPGLKKEEAKSFFGELQPALTKLIFQIVDKIGPKGVRKPYSGRFPIEQQRELNHFVCELMGFDFRRGRIDEAVHPFCSDMGFDDIRLTTRYDEENFLSALYSTMHEAGHGLYEQGFRRENQMTPLAEYCSMAIHESQSRLWENMVGRSQEFVRFLLPIFQAKFQPLHGVSFDDLYCWINTVQPSLIRVEADEVSYGLHVIIRFELEQELFSGNLPVDELPAAWNKRYQEYLGVSAKDDLHGILQDVHWYTGSFGYFPTYLLGSAYAAQIFASARREIPDLEESIGGGQLMPLKMWLTENIHEHGKRYAAKDLIKRTTKEAPNPRYYLDYLQAKFSRVYKL